MATVYSTTVTTPLQYPSTTYMDRHRTNGNLYVMGKDTTSNQYSLYRSTNGGTSFSSFASFTRANLAEMGSIYIGKDGWVRLVYRVNESSLDKIYIRGLNTDTGIWETELLLSSVGNGGSGGSVYQGIDVWMTISGGTEYYAVAVGYTSGANHGVKMLGAYTRPIPGTTVADNTVIQGTRQWLVVGSGRVTPCIDAQHTGDGKTTTNPHLWVAFGRTSVLCVKLAWNGDGWTGPTTPVTLKTGLTAADTMPARWDGTRFIVATRSDTDTARVVLRERNAGNTDTAIRVSPAHSQGAIRSWSFNYNTSTKDVRVYAVGTTINDLYYVDYARVADAWGSWVAVTATDILGAGVDNWALRRSTYGNSKFDVLTAASGAPNVITHTGQTVSYSPLPGVWNFTGLSHTNGGARIWNTTLPINWTFMDVDPGSAQTAYAIRRQIGAGTFAYWRASDSTWQAAEVKNSTSSNAITVPANWASADAEATHSYWLKTWNTADLTTGYTGDVFTLTPSSLVNPTITAPTTGSVVTVDTLNVTWTVAEETAYQLQIRVASTPVIDTGKVTGTLLALTPAYTLVNGGSYDVKLTTWNNENLASTAAINTFTVTFTAPATPTLVCTPSTSSGWIAVVITNPTPGGGQPAVDRQDLYRRETAVGGEGTRIAKDLATGATYNDWRAVSGIAYEYRVQTFGVNGANVFSAWTA